MSTEIKTISQSISVVGQRKVLINATSLAHSYWKQRTKDMYTRFSEVHLFSRIRQRQRKNQIYMLRGREGNWMDNQQEIEHIIIDHFKLIFKVVPMPDTDDNQMGENIDLVLQELYFPTISENDSRMLLDLFSDREIQEAMFDIHNDKCPGLDGFLVNSFNSIGKR